MGKLPKFDMDEVLIKTMDQFWRHGYSATSIRDLENATGLFRGSLYHAFGGKREMFFRALHRYDQLYREIPIKELEKHPSPRQAVLSVFEAALEVTENGSSDGCLEVNVALEGKKELCIEAYKRLRQSPEKARYFVKCDCSCDMLRPV